MGLGEIISDAVRYPFSDITKFLIVGILSLLAGLSSAFSGGDSTALALIISIITLVFTVILSGYSVQVIKKGIQHSNEIPDVSPVENLIDGIKVLIIQIVYYIIPLIIALVFGLLTSAVSSGFNILEAGLSISVIVAIIVFILFSIFEIVAVARFADTGDFGAAFNIGEVFEYVKKIGILNIILFLIVAAIIVFVLSLILGLLSIIPYIGIFIALILVGGFMVLFYYKGIGLLYASA